MTRKYVCWLKIMCKDGTQRSTVLDERTMRQGIRHFEMIQNEDAPAGALPYTIIMNSVVPLLNKWFHQKKYGRA